MVIGSTEVHYTASKTFQAILSKRPVFSIFHELSSANSILKEVKADTYSVEYRESLKQQEITILKLSYSGRILNLI